MTGIVRVEGTATPTPTPHGLAEPESVADRVPLAVAEPLADRDARSAGHDDHRRPHRRDEPDDPSFTFTSTQPSATFECKLDTPSGTGTYTSCTSPRAYTTTANGTYTFSVRSSYPAGNVDPTPATRSFTVDTGPPDTTITSGPSGTTSATSASFGFTSSEPGTFECKLDRPSGAGTYALCTSPQAYTAALDGSYTFSVRAIDAAGNVDPTPATRTFIVDTTTPDTTINTGPTGTIATGAASFTFSGTELNSTFECKLDGPGAATGTYAPCTSPQAYSALADGTYTFSVRAKDAAGNLDPTPATRTFTVDTTAPDTTLTGTPPTFSFTSSEPGSTFECKLDGPGATTGTYAACTSPQNLGTLADGTYTFSVRAKDAAGNVDPTPATRTFTVDTTAPDTAINSGPTGTIAATSASFVFTSEQGATFECKLDRPSGAGTYAACTSPQAYTQPDRRRLHVLRPREGRRRQRRRDARHAHVHGRHHRAGHHHHDRDHGRAPRPSRSRASRARRSSASSTARPAPAPTPPAPRRRPTAA